MKELICLCKAPIIPGVAATVLADALEFAEADISNVYMDDPWWGIIDLTVLPFNAVTYAAYSAAAPPAWADIMFNADRSAFICGTGLWWGKAMAHVAAKGTKVLVS